MGLAVRFEMVGSAGNAPVVASGLFNDTGFTGRQPDRFPKWSREWESHPPAQVYEACLCSLVEFPAVKLACHSKLQADAVSPKRRMAEGLLGAEGGSRAVRSVWPSTFNSELSIK